MHKVLDQKKIDVSQKFRILGARTLKNITQFTDVVLNFLWASIIVYDTSFFLYNTI